MDESSVRYYFVFNSPYSFLASTRIEKELAPLGVRLDYKPVYSPQGATSKSGPRVSGPPADPIKIRYMFADVGRFAEAYGLHLDPGPFADTGSACRGFLFAEGRGAGAAFHDAVYSARFLEGRDIGSEEALAEIAERVGLKRTEFLSALGAAHYAEVLERIHRDARADDVFGFPFFLYQGKCFWGNDRIEWLVREVRRTGTQAA